MRWIQWTCCAGVFAAVVMAGVHPASAEVILTDNFNDNNLNANPDWSLAGEAGSPGYLTGSPTNSGGVLAGGLANMALSVTDPNATGAVTINFRMRLNSDNQGKKEFAVYLGQIDGVAVVLAQDPRHHRVLREIIVGAPGERVQAHQVLEIGDPPVLPVLDQRLVASLEDVPPEVDVE